jgi:hypothetical protein
MKQTIGFSEFQDAFTSLRPQNFSLQGLGVLWDYLEQYEQDINEEIELDVIALCCDFAEDTPLSIAEAYGIEIDPNENDDEIMQQVKDFLEVETIMLGSTDTTIVYRQF